jgi:hypothetical protein
MAIGTKISVHSKFAAAVRTLKRFCCAATPQKARPFDKVDGPDIQSRISWNLQSHEEILDNSQGKPPQSVAQVRRLNPGPGVGLSAHCSLTTIHYPPPLPTFPHISTPVPNPFLPAQLPQTPQLPPPSFESAPPRLNDLFSKQNGY